MKQWVVGLTALGLMCAVGSIGAYGAEDEEKKGKVVNDKDKVEEGPKPKVEKNGAAPVKPGVIPPGTPMCYKYVTQYRTEQRTVCEWVRVTKDMEVEEVSWVPHPRKDTVTERYCELVKKVVPSVRQVWKTKEVKKKEKVTVCEWVTKDVDVEYVDYKAKDRKDKRKYTEYVPVDRKEKRDYEEYVPVERKEKRDYEEYVPVERKEKRDYEEWVPVDRKEKRDYEEYVPVDRKEKRDYEVNVPYTRKVERAGHYVVHECVPVTQYRPVVVHNPSPPKPHCEPGYDYHHHAPAPQVVCVPYTTYKTVARSVPYKYLENVTEWKKEKRSEDVIVRDWKKEKKSYDVVVRDWKKEKKSYDVVVVDYKPVKKSYDVVICEYKLVKKSYDVVIRDYKPVEKEEDVVIREYERVVTKKKEKVKVLENVTKEIDVVYVEGNWVEEKYNAEVWEHVWKERKVPVEYVEYKQVVKKVKRPVTSWQLVKKVVNVQVPYCALVAYPCPPPAPCPPYHGPHHGHHH